MAFWGSRLGFGTMDIEEIGGGGRGRRGSQSCDRATPPSNTCVFIHPKPIMKNLGWQEKDYDYAHPCWANTIKNIIEFHPSQTYHEESRVTRKGLWLCTLTLGQHNQEHNRIKKNNTLTGSLSPPTRQLSYSRVDWPMAMWFTPRVELDGQSEYPWDSAHATVDFKLLDFVHVHQKPSRVALDGLI
jgi:hypothetical protein